MCQCLCEKHAKIPIFVIGVYSEAVVTIICILHTIRGFLSFFNSYNHLNYINPHFGFCYGLALENIWQSAVSRVLNKPLL